MTRSLKKGPWIDPNLLKKIQGTNPKDNKVIKTWSRSSTIIPEMVGLRFAVHNGKDFPQINITEDMVGHRIGEFVFIKKFIGHGGKMAKGQK